MFKILLVEDDLIDAESVCRALEGAFSECAISQATSLTEALAMVAETTFDAVLADLSLPDSTGLESVVQLKRACPESPIVVLTGLENQEISIQAIAKGAQDYLVKDKIGKELLEQTIRYSIQRHALTRKNDLLVNTLRESDMLLHAKNRRLEKACHTAQQFVDNVSHEFRTPLTVIMEYASLLADSVAGPVNADQSRLLGVIDDRASDLNNMVDDMLDVSKLESGLLGASRKRCGVDEIVEHVLPAIRRKAIVREVQLDVELSSDLPDVFCDSSKVGRVIVNLAINAIKFCGNPGLVTIFAKRLGESDLMVGVKDNGIGIPENRQREIFQRFSQLKTELLENSQGFGLGLNIAQELVEMNFGRMHVESIEGKGSTFSFTLPIDCPVEVTRRLVSRLAREPEGEGSISAVSVTLDEDVCDRMEADVGRFLTHILRQNDLIYPIAERQWLLLVSAPSIELDEFFDRLTREQESINRNRPRGPLPELQIEVLGTWTAGVDDHHLIHCVKEQLHERELCVV